MRQIFITLALLVGLNLSAQEKKGYELEDGTIRIEEFYPNGKISQVSYYYNDKAVGTWVKYDELGQITMKARMKDGRPRKIIYFQSGRTITIDRDFD